MKTLKKKQPVVSIEGEFRTLDIIKNISSLKIEKENGYVVTKLKNEVISLNKCSDKYGIFDFRSFVEKTLPVVSDSFQPQSYKLNIYGGIQDFKVFGEEIRIEDQIFKKMLTVFSSSNGYYSLIIDAGLFRQVCSNGMMASVSKDGFNIKTRHYHKAINEHLLEFEKRMALLDKTFDGQIQFIKELADVKIDFSEFLRKLIVKTDNTERKTMVGVAEQLGKKLLNSQTDKIDVNLLSDRQEYALINPKQLIYGDVLCEDIRLEGLTIYNCYTELFRNRNHAVIEKENRRIEELLLT